MMKKIIVFCLLIIFALGNICFAQTTAAEREHHTYYVSTGQDSLENPQPLNGNRHRRNHRPYRHHKHYNHHKHHNHHDDDDFAEDVVKGIIILGIAHEVFD